MKDVSRVLQEKEFDIQRVRKEIEALHLAIPLLAENRDWVEHGLASPLRFPHSEDHIGQEAESARPLTKSGWI